MGDMPKVEITDEHKWLQRLTGDWTYAGECNMGPDAPAWKTSGTETKRSLGGLWSIGEMKGEMPDGTPTTSIITLGYDAAKKKFVGTFIASMMTYMWPYEGTLKGNVLTLDSEGPSMKGEGMQKYQDIVEIKNDNEYSLSSQIIGDDGKWTKFMSMTFTRKA
jgi:hypothetical protein